MRKGAILLLTVLMSLTCLISTNSMLDACEVSTTIEKILENPGSYYKENETVRGYIDQYVHPDAEKSLDYYIKGEFAGVLRVTTKEERPPINTHWCIEALVVHDPINMEPYLVEFTREQLCEHGITLTVQCPQCGRCIHGNNQASCSLCDDRDLCPHGFISATCSLCSGEGDDINWLMIGLFAVLGILVIALIVILIVQHVRKGGKSAITEGYVPPEISPTVPEPIPSGDTTTPFQGGLETVPFFPIPGKLIVLDGPSTDKVFDLTGYMEHDGHYALILGRSEVPEGKENTRIQLTKDTKKFVSRDHAKIIYNVNEKAIYLKNLSTKSSTLVNGVNLKPEETTPIEDGCEIRIGNILLQYQNKK